MKNKQITIVELATGTNLNFGSLKDAYEAYAAKLNFNDYHSFRGRIHYLLKKSGSDKYNVIKLSPKGDKMAVIALGYDAEEAPQAQN
jgi:hypothetical protein